jgi:hypothetical protein
MEVYLFIVNFVPAFYKFIAEVAELVDAGDSKSPALWV